MLREPRSRQTRSTSVSSTCSSSISRPASCTIESLWSKVRPPETSNSPIIIRNTSSKASKSSSKMRGIGTSELPVLTEFDLPDRVTSSREKMIDCDLTLSRSDSSGSHMENLTEYDLARRESSHSSSSTIMYDANVDENSRGDNPSCVIEEKPSCSGHQGTVSHSDIDRFKCTSADSNDSISVELSHFRPIKICPRTPPKRLASGKVIDPPLIRTTPRNLSRAEFSSPVETKLSDIDASSPIMQRQLLSLAEERKHHVELMSKSTFTSTKGSSSGDNILCRPSLKKFAFTAEGGKKSEPSATVSSTDCIDDSSPLTSNIFKSIDERENIPVSLSDCSAPNKLIIPLEPKLDEFNISPLSTDANSPGKFSITNNSQKRIRHVSQNSPSAVCSPQRTIRDWVIKTNNSSCGDANPSPDLILDTGRDDIDGDVIVTEKGESMKPTRANQRIRNRVSRMKGQTNTIHKFLNKVGPQAEESKAVDIDNEQKVSSKQKADRQQWTNTEVNSSDDESVFSSLSDSMDRLSSNEESDSDFHYERKCKSAWRKRKTVLRESTENRPKRQLKSLPADRKKRKITKKGRIKSDYIGTFYSKNTSIDIVSQEQDSNSKHVDQEELDRLFAIQLQKQFELESKFNMSAQRFKGGKDEYHLRRKKCR